AVDSGRSAGCCRADSCPRAAGRIRAVSGVFVLRRIVVLGVRRIAVAVVGVFVLRRIIVLAAVGVFVARGDGGGDSADSRGSSRDTGTGGSGPGTGRIPLGGVSDFLISRLGVVFVFEIRDLIGAGALLLRCFLAEIDAGGEDGGALPGGDLGIAEVQLGLGHLRARLGQSLAELGGIGGTVRRI